MITIELLLEAGRNPVNAIPLVRSAVDHSGPGTDFADEIEGRPDGRNLAVLRFLLDKGADTEAQKWGHNDRGYASGFDWESGLNIALSKSRESLAEELPHRNARTGSKTLNIASRGDGAGIGSEICTKAACIGGRVLEARIGRGIISRQFNKD
ncbi:hypothetical protein PFICI_13874 [Pestalotiopsis fici W106-1]|uniref:Uncharacterized protein n=1 Tax=Pestalotiopsis fici (strain W106-1 / CGMCC3.15140) TaxID=1229662 RepID=W3WJF1_PESFW|nr:uncharacterized protein PFICI_13874 [Pestalotiopsis fici W106-1]ETS74008.1 hypothetical protein PFICI_13874 [Pestalotiopsis fici W106-1]